MEISINIGYKIQTVNIEQQNFTDILLPLKPVGREIAEEVLITEALKHPIGSSRLCDIVHPGETVAIITSDITRPMPTWTVLPPVLDELYAAGVRPDDITLVFALGSHRPHTEAEIKKLAGERAFSEIRCVDSDPADCVHMGVTAAGTPVDITRVVAEADRRICLGNIEYHYFAGYSGGAKAIMPGVSTRAAIQSNHSMMVRKDACAGNLETNPLRKDLEEAAAICGVDFICNVILDEHKKVIHAVAGDLTAAHRAGCAVLDTMYQVEIEEKADIVIASQGGAPKDLNLYQTQKALDNAKHAVRDGGIIILVGSCKEGLGEKVFEEWLTSAEKPEDLTARIQQEFRLGGHKAAAIAMVLEHAEIYLVSDLEPEFVKTLFMKPFPTVQEAYHAAVAKLGSNASVLVMPYGGSTLPRVKAKTI